MTNTVAVQQPAFLTELLLNAKCGRTVIAVTGDVEGLYPNANVGGYSRLEDVLVDALSGGYHILTFDINGVDFPYDEDVEAVADVSVPKPNPPKKAQRSIFAWGTSAANESAEDSSADISLKEVVEKIAATDYSPLACLELIRKFADSIKDGKSKPICVIVRDAATVFPHGEPGKLSDAVLQRLQSFLNWVRSPEYTHSGHLAILVNNTRSELQQKIFELSNATSIEISLPLEPERLAFIGYLASTSELPLDMTAEQFAAVTAALSFSNIRSLVEESRVRGVKVTSRDVDNAKSKILAGILECARVRIHDHDIGAVDFYDNVKLRLLDLFEDCKNPKTAVSVIGISGANGTGKTWIAEGVAASSGWTILELTGLRSSDFGGTEKLFEQLRYVLRPFNRVIIFIDEADTDLGDVRNNQQSHEVERRLYGKIIAMMSDKQYRGKIVWLLMSARPDRYGADVLSRMTEKHFVRDLEGDEAKAFARKQFERTGLNPSEDELVAVVEKLKGYPNRELTEGLIPRLTARRQRKPDLSIAEFLGSWQPATSNLREREYQQLVGAQNCSYPDQLPQWIRDLTAKQVAERIEELKFELGIP